MRAALGGVLVFAVSGLGAGFGWAGSFTIEPGQSALVVQSRLLFVVEFHLINPARDADRGNTQG